MPISETEDNERIADIERWHLFNRDPSDEHWRDIDALLHRLEQLETHNQIDIEDMESEHKAEITEIENYYQNELKDHRKNAANLEEDLHECEKELAETRKELAQTRKLLIEQMSKSTKLTNVARKQAARLTKLNDGDHVSRLDQFLKEIEPVD